MAPLRFSRPPPKSLFAGIFLVVRQCVRQLTGWPSRVADARGSTCFLAKRPSLLRGARGL
jgi:hypothetical protein